ncbi:MAG: type II toxin-antitoxin system HicA family toxin [Planctomycetaceae bacterium]|nr:type II toxin-antitoxin system HicA family toxin [Planctomycetaceae bacterium]
MGKLPPLKPAEVFARLEKMEFVEVRQRGSHKPFRRAVGLRTTVPFHKGDDISPVLLRQIARHRDDRRRVRRSRCLNPARANELIASAA